MPALESLLQHLSVTVLGDQTKEIHGIQYDSRKVQPGDLFACLPGATYHGHQFIPQVLAAGASVLLVADASVVPAGVTAVVTEDIRRTLAEISAAFFDYPAEHLVMIGVTGTNGKTTTTTLLRHILQSAGHPTGLIGTMAYLIGEEELAAPHTTPQAPDLQALLARMYQAGMTHAVMEISSHALCLHRVTGCRFDVTAFTNLTQDHLDFHGTLDEYRDAKLQLFTNPQYQRVGHPMISLMNIDDPSADLFLRGAIGVVRSFGLSAGDYRAEAVQLFADGSHFQFVSPAGVVPVSLQLIGSFNVSNALAALAMAVELGVTPEAAAQAVAQVPPLAGRFQRVPFTAQDGPSVVVDYAHTPDGLEKVLSTAHEIAPGRVVVVFGCGGDRDRTKRPQMASIAAHWAREIYVTSDNPRTENPRAIIEEILSGFQADELAHVTVEADRAAAIRLAITQATTDDLIILAGKGHEDYQIIGTEKIHFDDREVAMRVLHDRSST